MAMINVTISGKVSVVEEARGGKILWVAFQIESSAWKVILKGEAALDALQEVAAGYDIVASGSVVRWEDGHFKLFADSFSAVDFTDVSLTVIKSNCFHDLIFLAQII